jgi:hypothetical protein
MPRSSRTFSPSGVQGPLAPSPTILTWSACASSMPIWFSSAAGMKMSALVRKNSSRLMGLPLG